MGIKLEELDKISLIQIIRNIQKNLDKGNILISVDLIKEENGNRFEYCWRDKTALKKK